MCSFIANAGAETIISKATNPETTNSETTNSKTTNSETTNSETTSPRTLKPESQPASAQTLSTSARFHKDAIPVRRRISEAVVKHVLESCERAKDDGLLEVCIVFNALKHLANPAFQHLKNPNWNTFALTKLAVDVKKELVKKHGFTIEVDLFYPKDGPHPNGVPKNGYQAVDMSKVSPLEGTNLNNMFTGLYISW